jgi:hypothetical protein
MVLFFLFWFFQGLREVLSMAVAANCDAGEGGYNPLQIIKVD